MPVLSICELPAAEEAFGDAPRGIAETSSIFSTIEGNVPENLSLSENRELFKQKKTIKTQIKSLKRNFICKVKWFRSENKPVVETFANDVATDLPSPIEQIATFNCHHIHQSAMPQNVSPPASAFLPLEENVVPNSPLDSEMPAPTWYAAHVPMLQDYVAEGVYGPGSAETDQDLENEHLAATPRAALSMSQHQSMLALSELHDFDTLAMLSVSFHVRATESDIESALLFSTDDSGLENPSDSGSDQILGVSKTSTKSARSHSDLSTLGDDSSSLDGSSNIDSDYDEALVRQDQTESSEFGGVSSDLALHEAGFFSEGHPVTDSGPVNFAAVVNLAPEVERPLQAMQARPRVHVIFEDNVHAAKKHAALPGQSCSDADMVQYAGIPPRTLASNGDHRCSTFDVYANHLAPHEDKVRLSHCCSHYYHCFLKMTAAGAHLLWTSMQLQALCFLSTRICRNVH